MEPLGVAKVCVDCREALALDRFTRNSLTKDGLERRCRACRSIWKRAEYERSRPSYIKRAQRWHAANKDRKREYDRQYRARKAAHLDAIKTEWRAKNAEKVRLMKAAYKKRNPHRDAEHAMRRVARKRNATPSWLTEEHFEQMREIYLDAATRPGGPWHVDHIVPLAGKTVCGLHVPWNLRVIPKSENLRKQATLDQELAAAA